MGMMGYGHYTAAALRPPIAERKRKSRSSAAAVSTNTNNANNTGWCLFDDSKMYQVQHDA
jgi:hypothetical protein